MKRKKKTFCEARFVIKPYLTILTNCLHGRKHAVNTTAISMLFFVLLQRSNNEHTMYCGYCHIGHTFTGGLMEMQQSMAGLNETEKDYLAFMVRWLLW